LGILKSLLERGVAAGRNAMKSWRRRRVRASESPAGEEWARPRGWPTLRGRITAWTTGVFALTLSVSAVIGVVEERSQVRGLEAAQAEALLGHLAAMAGFQGDAEAAKAQLAPLLPSLRRAGADLRLVALSEENAGGPRPEALARWPLSIGGRAFELRYEGDGRRLAALTKRAVLFHAAEAVLALGALLLGLRFILKRNLVDPLREISRAVDRMRGGGGWRFAAPQTDAELSPLVRAVSELGPGLEEQVSSWITVERRAAVAVALSSIQKSITEPLARARTAVAESQVLATPEERARLSSVRADLERIEEAFAREERYHLLRSDSRASRPQNAWPVDSGARGGR
jgi:hypothetical protein